MAAERVPVASELGEVLSQNEPSELIAEIILIDSHQAEEVALVRIERYLLLFGCIAQSGMCLTDQVGRSARNSQVVCSRHWNIPGLGEQGE